MEGRPGMGARWTPLYDDVQGRRGTVSGLFLISYWGVSLMSFPQADVLIKRTIRRLSKVIKSHSGKDWPAF